MMPNRISSRMDSVRDVEDELRVRSGGHSKGAANGHSWEFKSVRRGVGGSLRRIGRRSSGGRQTPGGSSGQRAIVKASFTVHKTGRGRGALQAHVRYLGRDAASLDGQPGRFYDAEREAIDARAAVREWEQDRHHFRLIVSPERADLLDREPDGLSGYVREWMARVERDLGTRLDWAAVNHHNTDDLHAHVLIRGKRDDGKDLVIPRQYLSHGLRGAAQEIATRRLGPRTSEQMRHAAEKELSAERYTPLDAAIERRLDGEQRLRLRDYGKADDAEHRRRVAARLQHLERLGLATRDRHGQWTLPVDLRPRLRALSERGDIIKNLHATLGRAAATVDLYRGDRELTGHVVARGTHDELRGSQYVLVRALANQRLHYVRLTNPAALRGLEDGGIARIRDGKGRVEVLSARSVESQTDAPAWTWLDRQMHRLSQGKPAVVAFDATLEAAATARRRWMIEHGHAATQDGQYRLKPGAADTLRRREEQAVARQYQERDGVTPAALPVGGEVEGTYRRTLHLHGGPQAVVEGRQQTYLVPVTRVPTMARGAAVVAQRPPVGRGTVVPASACPSRSAERE
jgi:type IV secretory pathway VirD2 relaxase